jgi:glycine/D-amino acid oxidase-like deaminating enzyme
MLAPAGAEIPVPLRDLAEKSYRNYPEFVHELEDESGIKVDFREQGTILLSDGSKFPEAAEAISADQLPSLEPQICNADISSGKLNAAFVSECTVDPRLLVAAATKAAHHLAVDLSSGTEVRLIEVEQGRAVGVRTDKTSYPSAVVVNCAGAWAGALAPHVLPVHPVKGQMLAVVQGPALRHVVRSEKVYLVPRGDGRLVIGSTLENAGYDKTVQVNTIQGFLRFAVELLPELQKARQHEVWAGLRPGTPDNLPILGETSTRGYFAATGHYRDGILLAPITAEVMTSLVLGKTPRCDLSHFSPRRFASA